MRAAAIEDFEELAPLAAAATREMNLAKSEQEPEQVEQVLRRAILEGRQFIWADGASIRTLASCVEAHPRGGARIRGVFMPPEFRGRGYGSAITGALAERLLSAGQGLGLFIRGQRQPDFDRNLQPIGFPAGSELRFGAFRLI